MFIIYQEQACLTTETKPPEGLTIPTDNEQKAGVVSSLGFNPTTDTHSRNPNRKQLDRKHAKQYWSDIYGENQKRIFYG